MSIAHGIVVGGRVIPGTERVIRDSSAWWEEGRETRARAGATIDMVIGHWTAGPARTGPGAGRKLFAAMEARTGEEGRDLSVSVQLSNAWDGLIWQHADLLTGCVHVGARAIIRRSVGIENMWPGSAKLARELELEGREVTREIDGRRVRLVAPSDEQLASWRWLCDVLTSPEARALGIHIPRRVLGLRRSLPWLARCGGGIGEHATLPRATNPRHVKIDCAGLLMEATGYAGA